MKKVLCLILALSLAIMTSAAAFADGLMSFDLEIVNDKPVSQKEKPSTPSDSGSSSNSSSNSGNVAIDIPAVVDQPSNGNSNSSSNSGSSGNSNSSSNSGSSSNSNGGSSNGSSSDSNISAPSIVQDSGSLTVGDVPSQNANNAANDTATIEDAQVPLAPGTSPSIEANVPQIITGPDMDAGNLVTPLDGGIAEHEISDFEINGDAMHSLRIKASIAPGSVVSVGDRVELTAIPMGFVGVNFKIQWQMAEVDSNGNMGQFHNIPGAFGLKYVIVFTERNINNHWRAAITIVD